MRLPEDSCETHFHRFLRIGAKIATVVWRRKIRTIFPHCAGLDRAIEETGLVKFSISRQDSARLSTAF